MRPAAAARYEWCAKLLPRFVASSYDECCLKEIAETASAEDASQVIDIHVDAAPIRRRRKLGAILPVGTKLIVTLSLFGIRQNLVSLIDLLEFVFGDPVTRVHIGMVLASKPSIGLTDLILSRVPLYPQHFVVVFEFDRHQPRLANSMFHNGSSAEYLLLKSTT